MTAEIAILSRTAVVLAADSATTVTSWEGGQPERRYFKGANKLYELSRTSPVGLMIFGSADIQGVPWELAIKTFRETLGRTQYERLETYPERFFDFVESAHNLFSEEARYEYLIQLIGAASFRLQQAIAQQMLIESIEELADVDLNAITKALDEVEASVEAMVLSDLLTEADIANATARTSEAIEGAAADSVLMFKQNGDRAPLIPRFTATLIKMAVKQFPIYANKTGVVVAGFGTEDYFPALEEYECYGFLGDRLIFSRKAPRVMSASSQAVIQPFATTHMIDTFRMGISPDVFDIVHDATAAALSTLGAKVMGECGAQTPISADRLKELISEAQADHADTWYNQIRTQHVFPLSNIINLLPLPDMAGLAKSLIELESLKERVTRPSESVSGPIDVAVISKHDGFVWIDRKHYFRPELNPRFFNRSE